MSGELYRDYLQREVLERAGMSRSGFFAFDRLPEATAAGYIELPDGGWRTNISNATDGEEVVHSPVYDALAAAVEV